MKYGAALLLYGVLLLSPSLLPGQASPLTSLGPLPQDLNKPTDNINPLSTPELSPGQIDLLKLEVQFAADVAKGGGKAFASWFADDAVTLTNGQPAKLGRAAIVGVANWDPKTYQLTWKAEGARMGPGGDTGFTWGHYDAISRDSNGQPVTLGGRYITFWKKVNGEWKVALDASADDAPAAGDCCALPKP